MEVAVPSGGTKKHIEEWSRLDSLTGMLEHARVEADHWASNTSNSTHHFGKVVDSRARNLADGSVQQKQQTKQLELFQAHIPGGSVQVIRSHTSTSSSWHNTKAIRSSSQWPSEMNDKLTNPTTGNAAANHFDNFRVGRNLVDLSSEKTKANVARSISNRRPPTRNRAFKINGSAENGVTDLSSEAMRICNEVHENAKKNLFSSFDSFNNKMILPKDQKSVNGFDNTLKIHDNSNGIKRSDSKKSTSDENLAALSSRNELPDSEDSLSEDWKRSSKIRWSLQYPLKWRKDTDNGISNHEKMNQNGDKTELQRVLEKVLNKKQDSEENDIVSVEENKVIKPVPIIKRQSFVTEETLKETKNKLRRCSVKDDEDIDDGIDAETIKDRSNEIEKSINGEKFINGTGSLECRSSHKSNSNSRNKSDEWYNRRKSYGFEQVYAEQPEIPNVLKSAQKIDSSTDSGICRSIEIVTNSISDKSCDKDSTKRPETLAVNSTSHNGTTVVTLKNSDQISKYVDNEDEFPSRGKISDTIRRLREKSQTFDSQVTVSVPVTRKFQSHNDSWGRKNLFKDSGSRSEQPILEYENDGKVGRGLFAGNKEVFHDGEDIPYKSSTADLMPLKSPCSVKSLKSPLTVKYLNDSDQDNSSGERKPKKVEFCKTEIHFAAEPGKINIVETDVKPPPNNLYRKRKKNVDTFKQNGLPETKFGDSCYEQNLLMTASGSPKFKHQDTAQPQQYGDSGPPEKDRPEYSDYDDKDSEDENLDKSVNIKPLSVDDNQNLSFISINNDNAKYNSFIPKAEKITCVPVCSNESTTTDNGLAVRISSNVVPVDFRRASWSVSDKPYHVGSKGYSTKVNFGDQGATIIPDSRDMPQRMRHSICGTSESVWKVPSSSTNVSRNENTDFCREKLIVRIGSGSLCTGEEEYIQEPTFCHSFRNSIHNDLSVFSIESSPLSVKSGGLVSKSYNDNLKSSSLIIETIKNTASHIEQCEHQIIPVRMNNDKKTVADVKYGRTIKEVAAENENCRITEKRNARDKYCEIDDSARICNSINDYEDRNKSNEMEKDGKILEQPSTYITEMNKLQQKYANGVEKSLHNSRINTNSPSICNPDIIEKSHFSKSGSSQNPPSILPSVLSAFDNLSRQIDQVIIDHPKIENVKTDHVTNSICNKKPCKLVEHINMLSVNEKSDNYKNNMKLKVKKLETKPVSSQFLFLNDILKEGEISDDSLKADEEVRSYMSNECINDDNDNILEDSNSGSHKFIKPLTIGDKENTEKLHSQQKSNKDLRQPTIKQSKTTAVTVGFSRGPFKVEKHFQPIKSTSVLLENNVQNTDSKGYKVQTLYNHQLPKLKTEIRTSKGDNHFQSRSTKQAETDYKYQTANENVNSKNICYKINDSEKQASKIIYHKIMLDSNQDSVKKLQVTDTKNLDGKKSIRREPLLPNDVSVTRNKTNRNEMGNESIRNNGSIRRKVPSAYDKEKLFSSGRDGWLNIPKERKPVEQLNKQADNKKQHRISDSNYRKSDNNQSNKTNKDKSLENDDLILELTKAADEILLAVGGYTDPDSCINSEDDLSKKHDTKGKRIQPLTTIAEKPNRRLNYRTRNEEAATSNSNHCSNNGLKIKSSNRMESAMNSAEIKHNGALKPDERNERSKRRTARMLHRACSREMLLQANGASSSEDIGSENETNDSKTKPKYIRKSKTTVKSQLNGISTNGSTINSKNTVISNNAKKSCKQSSVVSNGKFFRTDEKLQHLTIDESRFVESQVKPKNTKLNSAFPSDTCITFLPSASYPI